MSDVDVQTELLEAFLDGELSREEADRLRQRLTSDAELSASLDRLVRERSLRDRFFATLERHDSSEDVLVGKVIAGVEHDLDEDERRALAWSDRMRMLRYVSGAAACVMFSFFAGWVGHGHSGLTLPGINVAEAPRNVSNASLGTGTLVSNTVGSGNAVRSGQPGGVNVALTDSSGRVIAVQHFDSVDEAREFTQDVSRWQQRQQQIRRADPLVTKDRF